MPYCENVFCVYWKGQYCSLNEISLDAQGSCTDCVYVRLEEKYLTQKREESRRDMEKEAP